MTDNLCHAMDAQGFWQNGWTISIGGGLAVVILGGWMRRKFFGHPTDRSTTETNDRGIRVGGSIYQSGGTNVVGETVTIQGPSADDLARANLRAAEERRRAVEQAQKDIELCIVLATDAFDNFLRDPADERVSGQVSSAVSQWASVRPSLADIVPPDLIEECETFFGDAQYHFQTLAFQGPPPRAEVDELLVDAQHLIRRVAARLSL